MDFTDAWKFDNGTRAVVTGGIGGIGVSIVEELVQKGAKVLTCDTDDKVLADQLTIWRLQGYQVEGLAVDLSTASGRFAFADAIRTWLQGHRLDILVNNVGSHSTKTSSRYKSVTSSNQECSEEESEQIWSYNFHSMFMLTSICYSHLKQRHASKTSSTVVNVSDILDLPSFSSNSPYPTAKAAMAKATGDWACEWGKDGIRVNCVAPSWIKSDSNTDFSVTMRRSLRQNQGPTPLGRMGEMREVAGLVTFLCLPIAGFITGQVMCVDGGYSRSECYDEIEAQRLREKADEIVSENESLRHLILPSVTSLEEFCRELEAVPTKSEGEHVKAGRVGDDSDSEARYPESDIAEARYPENDSTGARHLYNGHTETRCLHCPDHEVNATGYDDGITQARFSEDEKDRDYDFRHCDAGDTKGQEWKNRKKDLGQGRVMYEASRHDNELAEMVEECLKKSQPSKTTTEETPSFEDSIQRQASYVVAKHKKKQTRKISRHSALKESPLRVIDEVVEADFDDNVDTDLVKAFRARLKRIQERKKSRMKLLERSRSLRCVFPSVERGVTDCAFNIPVAEPYLKDHGSADCQLSSDRVVYNEI